MDKLLAELRAYMHCAMEQAGNWQFQPFPQPTTVEEVKHCQHKEHSKTGLAILAWWKVYAKVGLPTWGADALWFNRGTLVRQILVRICLGL